MEKTHTYERKWRRINPYLCAQCGKPRYSFIFSRAKEKLCRSCARNVIPDNQPSLFAEEKEEDIVSLANKMTTEEIKASGGKIIVKPKKKKIILSPREAAKKLIESDVLNGRTVKEIQESYEGASNGDYRAAVLPGRKIQVDKIAGKELKQAEIFSLKEIYDEIISDKALKNLATGRKKK